MFMAYNIYACPNEGVDYDYQDLENIQKFYLNNSEKLGKEVESFMYKIVINRENCAEMVKVIKRCGASKEKYIQS